MEPLLQFFGHFWWLIFPVGGAAATAFRRFTKSRELAARRQHERDLELIRAGQLPPPRRAAAVGRAATPSAQTEQLLAAHDDVTRRWLEYELDVGKLIAFPAMSDGRQPLTAAFLRAKKVADRLRPASGKPLDSDQLREYREAVTDYEVAFDVAERDARRLKDSAFSPAERKRLETAQRLLTVAVDEAATPAERQLAYRRVREELDGLLSISDEAVEVLEEKVSLELTTGPTSASKDPDAPARPSATARPPLPPSREDDAPPSDTLAPGRIIRPKPTL